MSDAAVSVEPTPPAPPPGGVTVSDAPKSGGDNGLAPNANGKEPVADITESDQDGAPPSATWPDDWRERIAGKDEKTLAHLKRYASPENYMKAGLAAQQKIRSGEYLAKLPADASPEQVAEWRKEQGLPEKPDGYALTRVIGHEWTDADKPMLEGFFAEAHAANFSQAQVDQALSWYAKQQEQIQATRYEADVTAKQSLEDALRLEWGPEFRGNIGVLKRTIDGLPNGLGAKLIAARLEDGSRLIDDPDFVRDLVDRGRDLYGDASFVGGDGGIAAGANRKKEIENVMHTDPNRYWKDKGMQAEYLALTQREERSRRTA